MTQKANKRVEIERPNQSFVRKINFQSKVFTGVAVAFCAFVYFCIGTFFGGDAVHVQARFNTVFQSLLVAAWTWFMFPYIRVTLQMMLYGLELNERTAAFFSNPKESPLVQYLEKRLDEQAKQLDPVLKTWGRIGERVEQEFPTLLKKVNDGLDEMRAGVNRLNQAMEKNENLAAEVKPAIDALKRIEATVEDEIKAGLFKEMRAAAESIRSMTGIPKGEEEKPDPSFALNSIRRNKVGSGRQA